MGLERRSCPGRTAFGVPWHLTALPWREVVFFRDPPASSTVSWLNPGGRAALTSHQSPQSRAPSTQLTWLNRMPSEKHLDSSIKTLKPQAHLTFHEDLEFPIWSERKNIGTLHYIRFPLTNISVSPLIVFITQLKWEPLPGQKTICVKCNTCPKSQRVLVHSICRSAKVSINVHIWKVSFI